MEMIGRDVQGPSCCDKSLQSQKWWSTFLFSFCSRPTRPFFIALHPSPPPHHQTWNFSIQRTNKERFLGALAQEVNRGVRHLSHLVPLFGEGSGNGIPLLSVSAKVFCVRLLKISFVFPFSLFKAEPVQKKNKFLNLCFDLV